MMFFIDERISVPRDGVIERFGFSLGWLSIPQLGSFCKVVREQLTMECLSSAELRLRALWLRPRTGVHSPVAVGLFMPRLRTTEFARTFDSGFFWPSDICILSKSSGL